MFWLGILTIDAAADMAVLGCALPEPVPPMTPGSPQRHSGIIDALRSGAVATATSKRLPSFRATSSGRSRTKWRPCALGAPSSRPCVESTAAGRLSSRRVQERAKHLGFATSEVRIGETAPLHKTCPASRLGSAPARGCRLRSAKPCACFSPTPLCPPPTSIARPFAPDARLALECAQCKGRCRRARALSGA
jgi:hypothetical protein